MNIRVPTLLVLAALASSSPAASLSASDAQQVIAAAERYAHEHQAPGGAIAIVDDGGHLLALLRLDGSFPAASEVAIGKARTAAMFRKPTRFFEEVVNKGRVSMTTVPAVTAFTPLTGGIPLVRGPEFVGAVGVSGALSADQDEEIARAAAEYAAAHGHADASPAARAAP